MLAYDNAPARHRRGRQLVSNLVNNSKKKNKKPTYIVNMDLQSSTRLLNFKYPNTCTHFAFTLHSRSLCRAHLSMAQCRIQVI